MVPVLAPNLVAMDVFCCMGIGFLVAAFRASIVLRQGFGGFCADFSATFIALFLTQAYAARLSNAGLLRFYMVLALAFGAFVYAKVIAPYQLFVLGIAHAVLLFPIRLIFHKLVGSVFFVIKKWINAQKQKNSVKKAQKTKRKQLQKQVRLLYNSNVDLYTFTEQNK